MTRRQRKHQQRNEIAEARLRLAGWSVSPFGSLFYPDRGLYMHGRLDAYALSWSHLWQQTAKGKVVVPEVMPSINEELQELIKAFDIRSKRREIIKTVRRRGKARGFVAGGVAARGVH